MEYPKFEVIKEDDSLKIEESKLYYEHESVLAPGRSSFNIESGAAAICFNLDYECDWVIVIDKTKKLLLVPVKPK